jgi:hypothetical protein
MAVNQILLNYLPLSTFYYPYIQHPLGGTQIVYIFHLFHMIRPGSGRILFWGWIIENANLAII